MEDRIWNSLSLEEKEAFIAEKDSAQRIDESKYELDHKNNMVKGILITIGAVLGLALIITFVVAVHNAM